MFPQIHHQQRCQHVQIGHLLVGGILDRKAAVAAGGSYEAYMMTVIDTLPVNDAVACATLVQTVKQYQDKNFQKSGNNYVSTMKQEVEGMAMATSITLKTDGNKVTGYQEAMNLRGDMTYSATAEKPQTAPAAGQMVIDLLEEAA